MATTQHSRPSLSAHVLALSMAFKSAAMDIDKTFQMIAKHYKKAARTMLTAAFALAQSPPTSDIHTLVNGFNPHYRDFVILVQIYNIEKSWGYRLAQTLGFAKPVRPDRDPIFQETIMYHPGKPDSFLLTHLGAVGCVNPDGDNVPSIHACHAIREDELTKPGCGC